MVEHPTPDDVPAEPPPPDDHAADIARRFVSGVSWSLVAAVLGRIFNAVASVVIPRILGPTNNGTLGVVVALLSLTNLVGLMGTNTALVKFVPEYVVRDRERLPALLLTTLVSMLTTAVLVGVGLYLLADPIATRIYERPELAPYFRLAAIAVIPATMATLGAGALQGYQAFRRLAVASALAGLLAVPLQVAAALAFGLEGAIVGVAIVAVVTAAVNIIWVVRESACMGVRFRFAFDARALRQVVDFGFPNMLSAVFVTAAPWLVNTALTRSDGGLHAAGLFAAVWSIWELLLFIPSQAAAPSVPIYSELLARKDRRMLELTCRKNAKVLWIVCLVLALPIATSAPAVMGGMFGAPYLPGWPALFLLCAGVVVLGANFVYGFLIVAYGRMWHGFFLNGGWFLILLAGLFAFVPTYAAAGAAAAYLLAYTGFTVLLALYARAVFGIRVTGLAPGAALTAASFAIAWGLAASLGAWASLLALPLTGVVGTIVYRLGLGPSERAFLRDQARALRSRIPRRRG